MATPEQHAEAARLNEMGKEVLSGNLQDACRQDHILAAEGLLAFYEASLKLQLAFAMDSDIEIEGEGSMMFFRHAAELHLRIAEVM